MGKRSVHVRLGTIEGANILESDLSAICTQDDREAECVRDALCVGDPILEGDELCCEGRSSGETAEAQLPVNRLGGSGERSKVPCRDDSE